jgi:hypothetical protein
MTDTTSMDLDQNLALLGKLYRDFFDSPGCTRLFNDDSATGLGDIRCHCSSGDLWSTKR